MSPVAFVIALPASEKFHSKLCGCDEQNSSIVNWFSPGREFSDRLSNKKAVWSAELFIGKSDFVNKPRAKWNSKREKLFTKEISIFVCSVVEKCNFIVNNTMFCKKLAKIMLVNGFLGENHVIWSQLHTLQAVIQLKKCKYIWKLLKNGVNGESNWGSLEYFVNSPSIDTSSQRESVLIDDFPKTRIAISKIFFPVAS